jgi:nitrous oxide reductase accessory protein NosL
MKRILYCSLAVFLLIAICSLPAVAETVNCTECGMIVDMNSRFTAKIVQGDATSYFCDIGDLFSYLKRNNPAHVNIAVKDHPSGEWIDANTAYFVHNEKKFKTPMGWGFAAFRDKNRAAEAGEMMDLAAALKALK